MPDSSFPSPILTEQVNYTLVTPRTISGTDFCVKENTDYALALACFVRFAAPFFQYVVQYANYYHDQCMKEGVTPVRRLQMLIRSRLVMTRSRDKRRRRDSPVLHDDLRARASQFPPCPIWFRSILLPKWKRRLTQTTLPFVFVASLIASTSTSQRPHPQCHLLPTSQSCPSRKP